MLKMLLIFFCASVLFVCDAKYVRQNGESNLIDTLHMMLKDPEFNSLSNDQQYQIMVKLYKFVEMYTQPQRQNTEQM